METAMGTGVLVLALMLAFSLMPWRSAGRLSDAGRLQGRAEEALRETDEE